MVGLNFSSSGKLIEICVFAVQFYFHSYVPYIFTHVHEGEGSEKMDRKVGSTARD